MSQEQQRLAIAEACGWKRSEKGWWAHPTLPDNGGAEPDPPDYPNDLNAMHQAEKTLLHADKYEAQLRLVFQRTDKGNPYIWFANAEQRSEAFLRTIGKWEDA